jgi:sugar phosphate isomerase/epimerase
MKLSIPFGYMNRRYGSEQALKLIKDAGFDAVDYGLEEISKDETPFVTDNWQEYAAELKASAQALGIEFNQTHAPFIFTRNMWNDDDSFENYIMPRIARSIEVSASLGAKTIVVHPRNHFVYEGHEEEIFNVNMDFYRRLLPYAEKNKIKIAVENLFQTDPRRKCISSDTCSDPNEFIRYIDTLNSEWVCACLDIGHVAIVKHKYEPWDIIRALGKERLGALHVHDNNYREDSHSAPYRGKIDWEHVTQALGEIDYQGDFTYETSGSVGAMSDQLVPIELKYLADIGHYLICSIDRFRPQQ